MWKHVRGGMLLAVLGLIPLVSSATPASAQLFSRGCKNCQRPVNHCNCQSQQPVIDTQMVPQQVTTYRNEVVTQYRQEAVAQSVPVTTYRDIVVDEGSYQTVYVPKQVTKRIPQVTYQQQIAYRSVPYQVTRQVPQVTTQMVARQTIRQQPYSYQSTPVSPVSVASAPITIAPVTQTTVPVQPGCAPACAPPSCGFCLGLPCFAPPPCCPTTPMVSQPPIVGTPIVVAPVVTNPVTMLPPTSTATSSSSAVVESNSPPVPDPKFLDSPGAVKDSWTTVGSRAGTRAESTTAGGDGSGIRFKPARTVYRSWESQSRIAAGDGPERR